MLINPDYKPEATKERGRPGCRKSEGWRRKEERERGVWVCVCVMKACEKVECRKGGKRKKRGGWECEGWPDWQMIQRNEKQKAWCSMVDSAEFDTGDSHFPWTHLWVNGHLCFTFCTDLAHSCVPWACTIGEPVPFCLPASLQSQRAERKQNREENKSTIMLKEPCSRDSRPIRVLSDSAGVREEARFISKWNTSGNEHTKTHAFIHMCSPFAQMRSHWKECA